MFRLSYATTDSSGRTSFCARSPTSRCRAAAVFHSRPTCQQDTTPATVKGVGLKFNSWCGPIGGSGPRTTRFRFESLQAVKRRFCQNPSIEKTKVALARTACAMENQRVSSRRSHAWARRISWRTICTETPRASAVSSAVIPPK